MITSIGTVLDNPARSEPFLAALLQQAQLLGAHTAITVLTTAPVVAAELAPFGSLYLPEEELRNDAREAVTRVRRSIGSADDAVSISGIYGDVAWLAHDLRTSAEVVDLIVVGPRSTWEVPWLRRRSIETMLVASGTPLLLLPEGGSLREWNHVVLGWRASGEAVRAARDLIALAKPGIRIEVVTVGSRPPPANTAPEGRCGIYDFLSRHGFDADCHWIDGQGTEAEQLQAFASDAKADLLVVGGFGHSRVREILLGGVTRSLVEETRMPVLMAH